MKKSLMLLTVLTTILILALNGFAQTPDVKWRNGLLSAKTFEQLVTESDVIAHVKIMEPVAIYHYSNDDYTKFRAKVIKCYKNGGQNTEELFIYQVGSTEIQYRQNPLLETTKPYVLFLHNVIIPEEDRNYFDGEEKLLMMLGAGYGRYNIEGDQISAFLKPRGNAELKDAVSFKDFEKILDAKMKKISH
jgi:hypothetical protein